MEHRWLNRSVETAQRRVEQQHYAIRKRTLEYDDVMNKQRSIVYELRGTVLNGTPEVVHGTILDVMYDIVATEAERAFVNEKNAPIGDFIDWIMAHFPVMFTEDELKPFAGEPGKAGEFAFARVKEAYEQKCATEDPETLPYMERTVFLNCIDRQWQDYLRAMDDLRQGVSLRSYGQRDPLIEYKREAFDMFENLISTIKTEVSGTEFRATTAQNMRRMMAMAQAAQMRTNAEAFDAADEAGQLARDPRPAAQAAPAQQPASGQASVADVFASMMSQVSGREVRAVPPPPPGRPAPGAPAVGRNDPCPCGSGKKYKKCCGKNL